MTAMAQILRQGHGFKPDLPARSAIGGWLHKYMQHHVVPMTRDNIVPTDLINGGQSCIVSGSLSSGMVPGISSGYGGGNGILCTGGAYVAVPHRVALAAGDLTVRMIIVPRSWGSTYTTLFNKATSSANRELSLWVTTTGKFFYTSVGQTATSLSGNTVLTAGSVWDITFTRWLVANGGDNDVRVYVNGIQDCSVGSMSAVTTNTVPTVLGGNVDSTGAGDFYLLYFAAWTRAMSPLEVMRHYVLNKYGTLALA